MKLRNKIIAMFIAVVMIIGVVPTASNLIATTATATVTVPVRTHGTIAPNLTVTSAWVRNNIGVGWNLGNTFDSQAYVPHQNEDGLDPNTCCLNGFHWLGGGVYANTTPIEMETAWLGGTQHQTTETLINRVQSLGFDTIRIPITWHKVADPNNNWTIRADWLDRIQSVVNMAYNLDMFVIINIHHDDDFLFLNTGNASLSAHNGNRFVTRIWEQLADRFRDYDEKLIFEGLNEPRTKGSANEWIGGTQTEHTNLNRLNQAFVNTIRNSNSTNNRRRVLMVPTYAASATPVALSGFTVPADNTYNSGTNKIIMSVHSYAPFRWAHEGIGTYGGKSSIESGNDGHTLNNIRDTAQALGVPVVLGEWGSVSNSTPATARVTHAEDFITSAHERGMATIWWDNGSNFRLIDRQTGEPHFPNIVNAIMRGRNTGTATRPTVPQNFTATPTVSRFVRLSWTAPASNGGRTITRYEVSSDNGLTWVTANSNTTHTFTGLTNGQSYTFRVRAVNSAGNGTGATATATPLQSISTPTSPRNFEVEIWVDTAFLRWESPAGDGGSPITHYEVSSDNGTTWVTVPSNTWGGGYYEFTGLTTRTTYTFRVRAVNIAGAGSGATATATTFELPKAPQNFTATAGDGQVTLSWSHPEDDGGFPITEYEVLVLINNNYIASAYTEPSDIKYTFTELTNGISYEFNIRAYNRGLDGGGEYATVTATPTAPMLNISTANPTQNGGYIELHNPTNNAISTKGLYLSTNEPCRGIDCANCVDDSFCNWQMPPVIIRPNETIRIRAKNNNVCVVLKRMQTNFNFNAGETLYLTNAKNDVVAAFRIA